MTQTVDAGHRDPIGERHVRIDRLLGFVIDDAPLSRHVIVLERDAEGIDHAVAMRAAGIDAMLFQALAQRVRLLALVQIEIDDDIGRRRYRRRAEELAEHPRAPQYGRGAITV